MYYAVDRLEENLAVLEDENGTLHTVPREQLPAAVRQGLILRLENGRYCIDPEETQRRREVVLRLQDQLRHRR